MLMTLFACGGGGGGGSSNRAPVANAGAAQTVASGATVMLNGSASSDPDGSISALPVVPDQRHRGVHFQCRQRAGQLRGAGRYVGNTLTFSLVVTDNQGQSSTAASVTITVSPPAGDACGHRALFTARQSSFTTAVKLNYASPVFMPARGVVVRVLDANTQAVLASGVTLDDGSYSLNVPGNTSVTVQVEARLLRDTALPLPRWNIRVQNGTGSTLTPYRYTGAVINSTGGSGNVDIPLGINSSGAATGTRASGPFAILDTIYTALQAAITAMPTANFPALYVDWGAQTEGSILHDQFGGAYRVAGGPDRRHRRIRPAGHRARVRPLPAVLVSRDPTAWAATMAWGTCWTCAWPSTKGSPPAFAAIALNDQVYYDTFVLPDGSLVGGRLLRRDESRHDTRRADQRGQGCWCNEASVWSLVWDLYDANIDANDGVQLRLSLPIWQAMIGSTQHHVRLCEHLHVTSRR